ncbi:hypothetical protein X275_08280 [Marinitoga sp. 1197]|uniref:hypothetical protein n=1 Tax=Marinitoga sp. 1197 TaxID=1428449 RepID=UPI000641548E|nr:hypothetical protein [Marinitoga sp. 1197]KLO21878.1 hypothetical protein X275_08280 [Marinitoga sp. 1197]
MYKENKVTKTFNVATLFIEFQKLALEKHYEATIYKVYNYLLFKLNENFFNNPINNVSINKISKEIEMSKTTIIKIFRFLKQEGLIYYESKYNKTKIYFGELAREKIREEQAKKIQQQKKIEIEKESEKLKVLKHILSEESYKELILYANFLKVEIQGKEIIFGTENNFVKDHIRKKLLYKMQKEIKEYNLKLI